MGESTLLVGFIVSNNSDFGTKSVLDWGPNDNIDLVQMDRVVTVHNPEVQDTVV